MVIHNEGIAGNEEYPETGHIEHDNLELDGLVTTHDPEMNTFDPYVGLENLVNEENFMNDPETLK